MNPSRIGPGIVTAMWMTLHYVAEYPAISEKELMNMLLNTGLYGGMLPYDDGYSFCRDLGLIVIENDHVAITEKGLKVAGNFKSNEPPKEAINELIFIIVNGAKPIWLAYVVLPFEVLKIHLPDRWKETLNHAGLLNEEDLMAIAWWKRILTILKVKNDDVRKEIGELGERYTIQFEKERISKLKCDIDKELIIWISKISDRFGYDIKSIVGNYDIKGEPSDDLFIEVKSQAVFSEKFIFYLSRPEFNFAMKNKNHLFYFWNGVLSESQPRKLMITRVQNILKSVPKDSADGSGNWLECEIIIDVPSVNDEQFLSIDFFPTIKS